MGVNWCAGAGSPCHGYTHSCWQTYRVVRWPSHSISKASWGSPKTASQRLRQDGYNELPSSKQRTVLAIALEVVREPMFLLLVACGGLYMLMGETVQPAFRWAQCAPRHQRPGRPFNRVLDGMLVIAAGVVGILWFELLKALRVRLG